MSDSKRLFLILECTNPACRLRFPLVERDAVADCPRCHAPLRRVDVPFSSQRVEPADTPAAGPELSILLDNLRSAFNVGSILRTADGAGVCHAHLCGITPTPENPKVAKTALSAEYAIPWSYHANGVDAVNQLKREGMPVWALEGGPQARPVTEMLDEMPASMVLVAGNEVAGVDPEILAACNQIVSLPMQGFKGSLNVAVAFGIAMYMVRFPSRRTGDPYPTQMSEGKA